MEQLSWFIREARLWGWDKMDIQTLLAMVLGVGAFIVVIRTIARQLKQPETDPKCEECPVPEFMEKSKKKNSD